MICARIYLFQPPSEETGPSDQTNDKYCFELRKMKNATDKDIDELMKKFLDKLEGIKNKV